MCVCGGLLNTCNFCYKHWLLINYVTKFNKILPHFLAEGTCTCSNSFYNCAQIMRMLLKLWNKSDKNQICMFMLENAGYKFTWKSGAVKSWQLWDVIDINDSLSTQNLLFNYWQLWNVHIMCTCLDNQYSIYK